MKVSTSIIRLAIPASIVAVMCLSVAAAADDRYDVARRTSQAAQALQEKGHKVLAADGKVWCELWFAKTAAQGKATTVQTTGRHDPCVGIRATPIAEGMLACVLMDHALRHRAQCGDIVPPVKLKSRMG